MEQVKTYKFRIKDSNVRKKLNDIAKAVNIVWNYCNEASFRQLRNHSKWLSKSDLQTLTAGSSRELGLHSQTVQAICKEYTERRYQRKKNKLRWRVSSGPKRSLGWIPCTNQNVKVVGSNIKYAGTDLRFWKSREIPTNIRSASFNEDALGRWYINLVCVEEVPQNLGNLELGVDLGLKSQATLSDGRKFERENLTRKYSARLAMAQRAGKRKQEKAIHAKIANSRKDWNHKTANEILKGVKAVFVGDVSSSKLMQTRMAKSVSDAGWFQLKSFLKYKAIRLGAVVNEVNESWTSRTCSKCGSIGDHHGLTGLSVREWKCAVCGAEHDRDINAAVNILKIGLGHQTPIKGIPTASRPMGGCQEPQPRAYTQAGSSGELPAFDLVTCPHKDDKVYHKEHGENWFEPEMRISTALHEFFHR